MTVLCPLALSARILTFDLCGMLKQLVTFKSRKKHQVLNENRYKNFENSFIYLMNVPTIASDGFLIKALLVSQLSSQDDGRSESLQFILK
jgi:hypothetical protein